MSQVAFSHQFAHRWTNAPQTIKDALIQELGDIVHLLDNQTDLDAFEFTNPDLGGYIDNIYSELETKTLEAQQNELSAEQEAQSEIERLQQEHQAAHDAYREKYTLEEDTQDSYAFNDEPSKNDDVSQEALDSDAPVDNTINEAEETISDTAEPIAAAPDTMEAAQADAATVSKDTEETTHTTELNDSAYQTAPDAFVFENTEGKLDADFIKELESRIDDYLSEQLANMSEDLKSWLHDQISTHINRK